jgi:hypothetical protein
MSYRRQEIFLSENNGLRLAFRNADCHRRMQNAPMLHRITAFRILKDGAASPKRDL